MTNIYAVMPDRQDALVARLQDLAENALRSSEGFVSALIHAGVDKTTVANHTNWSSQGDYEAALEDPNVGEHVRRAVEIAESFDPRVYRVVSAHYPSTEDAAASSRDSSVEGT